MDTLYRWSKFVDDAVLEEWENRLIAADVPYTAEKQVNRKRWQLSSYAGSRAEAESLKSTYGGGVGEIHSTDWQPPLDSTSCPCLKIRDALIVAESKDEAVLDRLRAEFPDRAVLGFPPQLAFGTGAHPTTAGCLRLLADLARERRGERWRVLDLGCGSGILAVAAAVLGAPRVVAVENDEVALKNARRNAERHGVAESIEFLSADAVAFLGEHRAETYDVIAANLFSSLLIEIFPRLPGRLDASGEVVVSGFLTSQARSVTEAAADAGLGLSQFLRRGKWVAARGGRTNG